MKTDCTAGLKRSCASLLALLLAASFPAYSHDHDQVRRLRQAGKIVSLHHILKMAGRQIPGSVIEVELDERGEQLIYELEIIDSAGQVRKLLFDAADGSPLPEED
ncbi:MAG: PepSY domain-containing protein [Chromatiales bacterium]|nr:PepSY domain-containing protein [Chromatiales bacterium]